MLVLKNAYRYVFFLFALMCAPSFIYSDNHLPHNDSYSLHSRYQESLANDLNSMEEIENEMSSQDVLLESDLVGIAARKIGKKNKKQTYYLYIADFIASFIEIPTANVSGNSTTLSSRYLAGRAPVYNEQNIKAGTCSASFLCMQNQDGIYTDISNYLSVNNGLIVTWFTPTTLINLELDSIIHSMVTKCLVKASTKVGFNPFYGKTFNMVVSSDNEKIYFKLTQI